MEYSDCLKGGNETLASTNLLRARLGTRGHAPILQPARRLNPAMRSAVLELGDELEKTGGANG